MNILWVKTALVWEYEELTFDSALTSEFSSSLFQYYGLPKYRSIARLYFPYCFRPVSLLWSVHSSAHTTPWSLSRLSQSPWAGHPVNASSLPLRSHVLPSSPYSANRVGYIPLITHLKLRARMELVGAVGFHGYLRTHPPRSTLQMRHVLITESSSFLVGEEIRVQSDCPRLEARSVLSSQRSRMRFVWLRNIRWCMSNKMGKKRTIL